MRHHTIRLCTLIHRIGPGLFNFSQETPHVPPLSTAVFTFSLSFWKFTPSTKYLRFFSGIDDIDIDDDLTVLILANILESDGLLWDYGWERKTELVS